MRGLRAVNSQAGQIGSTRLLRLEICTGLPLQAVHLLGAKWRQGTRRLRRYRSWTAKAHPISHGQLAPAADRPAISAKRRPRSSETVHVPLKSPSTIV